LSPIVLMLQVALRAASESTADFADSQRWGLVQGCDLC
jgi:hypothetical protein